MRDTRAFSKEDFFLASDKKFAEKWGGELLGESKRVVVLFQERESAKTLVFLGPCLRKNV